MIALRDALVTRFASLPGVRAAAAHDEDFDEGEIRRLGPKGLPGVYVVHVETVDVMEVTGRDLVGDHRWAAVVMAAAGPAKRLERASRGDAAGIIAHRIAYELAIKVGPDFAGACSRPERIEVRNASTSTTAKLGVAVYVVEWRQGAPIRPEDLDLELADLELVATTITPDEGPETIAAAGLVGVEEEADDDSVAGETGDAVASETI